MDDLKKFYSTIASCQLKEILRKDCEAETALPTNDILVICEVLAEREPPQINAKTAYQNFVKHYIEKKT